MTEDQMLDRLKREVDRVGGQRAFARAHKMALSQVSKAIDGAISIPPRIALALGYVREVSYRKVDG